MFKTCLCLRTARRTRSTEEQLNKSEKQTNAQAEERAKQQPDEQTDSRMTEFTNRRTTSKQKSFPLGRSAFHLVSRVRSLGFSFVHFPR